MAVENVSRIQQIYRQKVYFYDIVDLPFRALRRKSVAHLALFPGAVVLDLGCGTGQSFSLFERLIGPEGRIIGVDISPEMLARAQEKVTRNGWRNVTLIQANAESLHLPPESVDALHCFDVHDIIISRRAMERGVHALRHGGHCVIAGPKQTSRWPGKLVTRLFTSSFVSDITRAATPWTTLEDLIGRLECEEQWGGGRYMAWGTRP
ncbi:MAG: class I SAM-dependent methyltransferase [Ktedonobacteraceae bacterium]|nr:class I SAM-dependent methyltransferase [Ktedonobacteraceae bacterium]